MSLLNAPKRVAKNVISLAVADVVREFLALLLVVCIARYLGDVGFGKYSFAFAFTGLFLIISNMGFNDLLIRDVAQDRSKASAYLGNMIFIKCVLSLVLLIILFTTISLMHYPPDTTLAVYIVAIYITLSSFAHLFRSQFIAFERMEYASITSILEKIVIVVLGLAVLFAGYRLIAVVLAYLAAGVVDFLVSLYITIKRFTIPDLHISPDIRKTVLRNIIPFGVVGIFATMYFQVDVVMLSFMKGDAVVGWYSAAYKLVGVLMIIPGWLTVSIFPALSSYYKTSSDSLKFAFERVFKYMLLLAVPLVAGTVLLADRIIELVYTPEFQMSVPALKILVWSFLFLSLSYVVLVGLYAVMKERLAAAIVVTFSVANIILNLLLIPTMGLIGAALASVITTGAFLIVSSACLHRELNPLQFGGVLPKAVVSTGLMSLLIYYVHFLNILLLVPIGVIVYLSAFIVLNGFDEYDWKMFRVVVGRG